MSSPDSQGASPWSWPPGRVREVRRRAGISVNRMARLLGVPFSRITRWQRYGVQLVEPEVLGRLYALEAAAGKSPSKASCLTCLRCGHRWEPRSSAMPKGCPRCACPRYEVRF